MSAERFDVVILGGGPSGLATAASLLHDHSFADFLIVEQSATVGGLWQQGSEGKTWEGMTTNLAKEKCQFSTLLHDEETPTFPSAAAMHAYFVKLAGPFHHKIRFESTVTSVLPPVSDRPDWQVQYTQRGAAEGPTMVTCRFLVVATGVFSIPVIPENLAAVCDRAGIPWVHSGQVKKLSGDLVRSDSDHVVVVGGAYSGADLALAIRQHAARVTLCIRTPRWYMTRMLDKGVVAGGAPTGETEAWDRLLEARAPHHDDAPYTNAVTHAQRHRFLASILPQPGESHPALRVDPRVHGANTVITNLDFLDAVKEGRLGICNLNSSDESESKSLFASPESLVREKVTKVVFATGYRSSAERFLPEEVLGPCEADFSSDYLPLVLYKATLHPTLDCLAFVGMYRGPYLSTIDVQARWVASLVVGKVSRPPQEKLKRFLEDERAVRATGYVGEEAEGHRHPFPHSNVVGFTDSIAEEIGERPLVRELPGLAGAWTSSNLYRLKEFLAALGGDVGTHHSDWRSASELRKVVEQSVKW
uniref:Flavin-containing monooxygenase n=1 Tax=Chromera velia CCMP2878 TaxID=1169474 RepID=A0A0G4GB23_9ALVE|eukprot:Cvel_21090.t1-p1 / transcript=Cvel_21090.t1 / gene=Cvel_21090 / organism=Chromera_velia_CCMP2878 / gene_product=Dimethylaniline monooxygenase [N-oxide-forming] 2, putative / transcript_product=Dimethylaniline monooxygenase [N-oxide-forming] 2, putative / location=Cvel_scaffold1950:5509-7101(-) / protein_length=531 / sequence_SO=supercontig / SO=protein_coding / is_pseudo=false